MGSALLLVDIQRGFDLPQYWDGPRNNPQMEANALALLADWRGRDAPRVIVQHCSHSPNSPFAPAGPGFALKAGFEPQPGDIHIVKRENSAFVGTDLEIQLRRQGIRKLVICGATTQHCVSTTVRMAENLGFEVILVADACFAMPQGDLSAQTIHDVECTILKGEFCAVINTHALLGHRASVQGPNVTPRADMEAAHG